MLDLIDSLQNGSYLIQMATGLGKTATFANIKRKGRVLVLAHREELVRKTVKYYDCKVGLEIADKDRKSTRLNSLHIQKSSMPSSA